MISLRFDGRKAQATLGVVTKKEIARFDRALKKTGAAASDEIKRRGDNDIRNGGDFSTRWTNDFYANSAFADHVVSISVGFKTIPYAHIHETGGTIRGRPLLWIPLSFGDAPKIGLGSGKVWARDYPGQLFKVERPGKNPLLFSATGPQYVGVTHVTLRPRWNIRGIASNVARTKLATFFHQFIQER